MKTSFIICLFIFIKDVNACCLFSWCCFGNAQHDRDNNQSLLGASMSDGDSPNVFQPRKKPQNAANLDEIDFEDIEAYMAKTTGVTSAQVEKKTSNKAEVLKQAQNAARPAKRLQGKSQHGIINTKREPNLNSVNDETLLFEHLVSPGGSPQSVGGDFGYFISLSPDEKQQSLEGSSTSQHLRSLHDDNSQVDSKILHGVV